MQEKFPAFKIDQARREIRLASATIGLEPRVFDVVAYLAANSDRVVSKDELLDAVWPDVSVGDGSLQRAVSVARAALRRAGAGDPIRSFARRGYRLCLVEPDDVSPVYETDRASAGELSAAQAAYLAGEWQRAAQQFALAGQKGPLAGADLEAHAHAVLRAGHLRQAPAILERAVEAYASRGERRLGARAAVALGMVHWQCGDSALARAWQRRGASLVAGLEDCRETGLVAWLDAFIKILECDFEDGTARAQGVYELGVRLADPDLQALGGAFSALGSLAMGRPDAAPVLDEAAATVVSGEVSPWAGAHILCGALWGFRSVNDWDRGSQLAEQYARWCERTGMGNSPGTWRLHRLEALAQTSDLDAALDEASELPAKLSEVAPWAVGDAWRVIGEILVVQHALDLAQAAFEEAAHHGWEAQPGVALLHLGRGRPEAAVRSLRRAIETDGFINGERRPVLEGHLILALAAVGDIEGAAALLEDVDRRPRAGTSSALQALIARGRAEILVLRGHLREATGEATLAAQRWSEAGSPLSEARSRLRLAQLLLADSDFEGADVEAGIACRIASRLHAYPLAAACLELRGDIADRNDRLVQMPEVGPWRESDSSRSHPVRDGLRESLGLKPKTPIGA